MATVSVLLSTYNGEKYIREQLESLRKQTFQDFQIFVRDDGSKDKTVEILREYEKEGFLTLEVGKNVGFIRSFNWLITHAKKARYYAFCDQDDVWFPEKLAMAVERLGEEEKLLGDEKTPILYFSNYNLVDEKLNFIEQETPDGQTKNPTFPNCIVDCMPLGFNSVFNDAARRLVCENTPKCSCGHDWWMYMLCQGLGKVIFDERPSVSYRRTGNNVSAGGLDFFKQQIWRVKKFVVNGYFRNIRHMHAEYYSLYKDLLSEDNRRLMSLFGRKHYNLIVAAKKVFYPRRFRQSLLDELLVRFFFLIGCL